MHYFDGMRIRSFVLRSVIAAGVCATALAACSHDDQGPPTSPSSNVAAVVLYASSNGGKLGATVQLHAYAVDASGAPISNRHVVWTSTAPAVASLAITGDTIGSQTQDVAVPVASASLGVLTAGVDTVTATVDGKSARVGFMFGADLAVSVTTPGASSILSIANDSVDVSATVSSLFQVAGVSATVGGRTVSLSTQPGGGWSGRVPIAGLAFGPVAGQVTATDVRGTSVSVPIAINHNALAVATLAAPASGVAAINPLHVVATCVRQDGSACTSLVVGIHDATGKLLAAVSHFTSGNATGVAPIDTTLTLAPTTDLSIAAVVQASGGGQLSSFTRTFYLASNPSLPHLSLVTVVPGRVLDYHDQRTLFADTTVATSIALTLRGADGKDAVVDHLPTVPQAALAPNGAVYTVPSTAGTTQLRQSRDQAIVDLGAVKAPFASHFAFAAYLDAAGALIVRDLSAGVSRTVSSEAGIGTDFDVAGDGFVAYSVGPIQPSNPKIKVASFGTVPTLLSPSDSLGEVQPKTDGINVAYERCNCSFGGTHIVYQTTLHTAAGDTVLSGGAEKTALGGAGSLTYAIENGWLAYTTPLVQNGTLAFQPRSRSPQGNDRPLAATLSQSAVIEAVSASGDVVFTTAGSRFVTSPPYAALTNLGSAQGRVIWTDGSFFVLVGGAVMKVVF